MRTILGFSSYTLPPVECETARIIENTPKPNPCDADQFAMHIEWTLAHARQSLLAVYDVHIIEKTMRQMSKIRVRLPGRVPGGWSRSWNRSRSAAGTGSGRRWRRRKASRQWRQRWKRRMAGSARVSKLTEEARERGGNRFWNKHEEEALARDDHI